MSRALPFPLPTFDRRTAALACTALVHVLLLLGWQAARRLPPAPSVRAVPARIQWIVLPSPLRSAPATPPAHAASDAPAPARVRADAPGRVRARDAAPPAPSAIAIVPAVSTLAGSTETPSPPAPDTPAAAVPPDGATPGALLLQARRVAGAADRALRKDAKPTIVAPPDSPMIRLRNGIEAAADAASTRWYEGPKIDELTNYSGDGERITRVRSGGVTYCVFTRSPAASIDAIEKQGKERTGRCPDHATPAHRQAWHTARETGAD